jgi:hypothetical protein
MGDHRSEDWKMRPQKNFDGAACDGIVRIGTVVLEAIYSIIVLHALHLLLDIDGGNANDLGIYIYHGLLKR